MQFVPIRVISVFFAIAAWVVGCGFSILAADEEPRASESLSQASPSATVQAEEKTEAQTSPKGTFKIESETKSPPPGIEGTDVADFVVSTTDPKCANRSTTTPIRLPCPTSFRQTRNGFMKRRPTVIS